jgi:hypothetical protein
VPATTRKRFPVFCVQNGGTQHVAFDELRARHGSDWSQWLSQVAREPGALYEFAKPRMAIGAAPRHAIFSLSSGGAARRKGKSTAWSEILRYSLTDSADVWRTANCFA